jgi:hypothetical protein
VCATRNAALSMSSYGATVYNYHFLRSPPPHTDPANPPYCSFNNSVCHGTSTSISTLSRVLILLN